MQSATSSPNQLLEYLVSGRNSADPSERQIYGDQYHDSRVSTMKALRKGAIPSWREEAVVREGKFPKTRDTRHLEC